MEAAMADQVAAPAVAGEGRARARRRVLIVNVFFDEYRRTSGSPHRVPRAMGPVYLAGAFARARCDVRVYNEQHSGVLTDTKLLAWAEMLVMTGVTSAFDRLLHLTAYARTVNPGIVVVAGGPAVRALPRRARRFFDYACGGDIEELQAVAGAVFGPEYAANDMFPRFDLAEPTRLFAYAESSRNCNFACSFCSLTGEKAKYQTYDLDYVRRQIEAAGRKHLVFIDNNFYGNDRSFFLARLDLLREMHQAGRIRGWSCLVTGDFFRRDGNLELMRAAGCLSLFSGIESFDESTLRAYNKRHSTLVPQVDLIRNCLEAGIFFSYGIMLDPSARRLADLRREIEFITGTPEITLPAFFTLSIPLLGTPYFADCVAKGLLLPNLRLRHLDGVTLTMRPLDPEDEVLRFVRDLPSLRGYRGRALRHLGAFLRRYRGTLSPLQLYGAMVATALISSETFASSPTRIGRRGPRPTWHASSEILDPQYTPMIRLAARYRDHFRPTMVTDADGALAGDVAADLARPAGGANQSA
jgi:hypothetical protein